MWVGIIGSFEGLNRTKGRGRKNLSLLCASLVDLRHLSQNLLPSTGIYSLISHGSQVFRHGLNPITSFPESPTCRWQIVGFLSLHNHVSQFLIINLLIPFLGKTLPQCIHCLTALPTSFQLCVDNYSINSVVEIKKQNKTT